MWITANTKGGVGKSTVAKHLLLPYLYQKYGEVVYISVDETNPETQLLEAKNIRIKREIRKPQDFYKLITLIDQDNIIIDPGAHISTLNTLSYLAKAGFKEEPEKVKIIIPLKKGITDVNEALKTYRYAKDLGFTKIALVLNEVVNLQNYQDEYIALYNAYTEDKKPPIEILDEETRKNLILFPYDDKNILQNIQFLEKRLAYDVYLDREKYFEEFRRKLRERKNTPRDAFIRILMEYLTEIFELILSPQNIQILERLSNA
jgi:hypothetical protein